MHQRNFSTRLFFALRNLAIAVALVAAGSSVRGQDELNYGICRDGSCFSGAPLVRAAPPVRSGPEAEAANLKLPLNAVVRIRHAQRDRTARQIVSWGTGALVQHDGHTVVVTCAHLFRGSPGTIDVFERDGSATRGQLIAVDSQYDLAAISADAIDGGGIRLSKHFSPVSASSIAVGFGSDGRLRQRVGRVLGYARTGTARHAHTMVCSGPSSQGDSGGPIFNASGELSAVLWGSTDSETYGTCCLRVREFLSGVFDRRNSEARSPIAGIPPRSPARPPGDTAAQSNHRLQQQLSELEQRLAASQLQTSELARQLDLLRTNPRQSESPVPTDSSSGKTAVDDSTSSASGQGLGDPLTGFASRWLSGKAAALLVGFGVPGWVTLLLVWVFKRRAKRRVTGLADSKSKRATPPPKLNDNYAGQLLEVFAQSGRSPVQDATLGREYDQEIRRAEESSDAQLARWAKSLRSRVENKFMRIHSPAPAPAEPVHQAI